MAAVGVGLTALLFTAAVAAQTLPGHASVATDTAAPVSACPKYFLYVVEGSGEREQTTAPPYLGEPGKAFYEAFAAAAKPDTVEVQGNSYPAVSVLWDRLWENGWYQASVSEGENKLRSDLAAFRARCDASKSQIIVFCYSQGAQVIHRSQSALDPPNAVSDVVLVGDPLFCAKTNTITQAGTDGSFVHSGDYDPKKVGINGCGAIRHGDHPLQPTNGRAMWSYCHADDRVCQGFLNPDAVRPLLPSYDPTHTNYAPEMGAAAWRVIDKHRVAEKATVVWPAVYFSCTTGRVTAQVYGQSSSPIAITAVVEGNGGEESRPIGTINVTQQGERYTYDIPQGAKSILAHNSYQPPVPSLSIFDVTAQGCAPKKIASRPAPPPKAVKPPPPGQAAPKQQPRQQQQQQQAQPPPVPVPAPAPAPPANRPAPEQHQDKPKPEVAPKPQPAPQPKLAPYASLSPYMGPPGTVVNASGGGWAPNKPVTVTQSGANASGGGGTIPADANGDIDSNFRIADGTQPGTLTITFRQGSSTVTVHFEVE